MLLRARQVLPLRTPPIEDGAVLISGSRIRTVGFWKDLKSLSSERAVDLGESVLLPGLINAHCHLDYTDLAGHIPPPKQFTDWIRALVALKAAWTDADFEQSWRHGAGMLLRHGCTAVADIEAVPQLLPRAWEETPLRVFSFREIICLKDATAGGAALELALRQWDALPLARGGLGISPHAPYTTTPELLRSVAQAARQRCWRLIIHVAESREEFEMFTGKRGPLFDWLQYQRDTSDCGQASPVRHLDACGCLDENLLAVHVNYLAEHDAELLGRRGVHVVHCPRSHRYFGHVPFPRRALAEAGVNLCLGTDSLVSVLKHPTSALELNLFAEMNTLAAREPDLAPEEILKLVTLNAARALGREGELGELAPNAFADMIAIPFSGKINDLSAAVVHHPGTVAASLIHGQWAIAPACASC